MQKKLERLRALDREHTLVQHIGATLGWDQETMMPEAAVEERSEQLALIEGLAHEKLTRPEIGDLLNALGSTDANPMGDPSLPPRDRAHLRALRRIYSRAVKLPKDLVEEIARSASLSQAAWAEARAKDDFAAFAPHLQKMLDLQLKAAACIDSTKAPYDVFLDQYEPDSDQASIAAVFGQLRKDLVSILGRIRSRPQVDDAMLKRPCPAPKQEALSSWAMDELAFPRSRGRLDLSAHPFTNTLGESDVRITTRYIETLFASSLFSTLHESGHALYELGLAPGSEYARTSLAEAASMAVHESQSRLWENVIGRSEAFWKRRYAKVQGLVAPTLDGVSLESFLRAINKVEPSLIRVEADEVTYGLHVILRFELEAELVSGRLSVADLPAAWKAKSKELLGIESANDREGCLQDVHWSFGAFGYFPSYALGNLYAAQFWDAMKKDIPDLHAAVEGEGEGLSLLLAWLREHIHKDASTYTPAELCQRVTGAPLSATHFVRYLEEKYARIYGF